MRPNKYETHQTHLTVGGKLLDYSGTLTTQKSTITTARCLFNGVVSTPNAKCIMADIKTLPKTFFTRPRVYEDTHLCHPPRNHQ